MKILAGLGLFLLCLLLVVAGGTFYIFNNSSAYRQHAEARLSDIIGREVRISAIESNWRGGNPEIMLRGISVAGDSADEMVFSSDYVIMELEWSSLLNLWPRFRNVTVQEPMIEVVSLPQGGVRVAGIEIQASADRPPPFQLFRWILDHWRIDLAGGLLRWVQLDGSVQDFRDIALVYSRDDNTRLISGAVRYPEGNFVLDAEITGNPFHDSDWDTSFSLIAAGDSSENSRSGLEVTSSNGEGHLRIARLELLHLRDILIVSGLQPTIGNWLQSSAASGLLEDVDLWFSGPLDKLRDWRLTAGIADMKFAPTESLPGITGIGGDIEFGNEGGELGFNVIDGVFDWPRNLISPVAVDQAGARLAWTYASESVDVELGGGYVRNADAVISDFVATASWRPGSRPQGELSFAFDVPRLEKSGAYLPRKATDKFRAWWNNAILGGRATNGSLSYSGLLSLASIKNNESMFRVSADFSGLDLDYGYLRGWPVLRNAGASFSLENDVISIQPDYGEFDNSTLLGGTVRIADLFKRARILAIEDGKIEGPIKDVINLLLRGPLVAIENQADLDISAQQGSYQTNFSVSMPLHNTRDVQVRGHAAIRDGVLTVPPGNQMTGINGEVDYTERSVSGSGLTAEFIGGDVVVDITTTRKAIPPEVEITASGVLDADELEIYLGPALASLFVGRTAWDGSLKFGPNYCTISGKSDLLGMTVAFPDPVYKGPNLPRSLTFDVEFNGRDDRVIGFKFGDRLAASLNGKREDGRILLDSGEIVYGGSEPVQNSEEGIGISVVESSLDLDVWLQTLRHMRELGTGDSSGFVDALRRIHVAANDLTVFEEAFQRVEMVANSEDGESWTALLTGERVNGWAKAAPTADEPHYEINFTHLYWPDSEDGEDVDSEEENPADYPRFNVHVDDFRFGERNLGALDLLAGPSGTGWVIEKLDIVKPELDVRVTGEWREAEAGQAVTSIDFTAMSDRGGEAMEALGFKDFVEGGGLEIEGNLRWAGGPGSFALKNLGGSYQFSATDGHLLQVDPKGGRLFGLMNINALSRRLRLDFSDIFEDGLAFDQMGSQGTLVDGDILLDSFLIIGPAVYMQAEGRVGLVAEDFDMEVVVSPQLGGNIALLSALANPAAGALVYLVQRIFSKQLNEAMHDTYVVTGPWDDATIERSHYEPPPPEPEPQPLVPVALEEPKIDQEMGNSSPNASEMIFRPIPPIDAGGVEGLPQGIPTPESPDYDLESEPLTNTP